MKLWDLPTQHCVQTVVAHRAEVWTLAVDAEQKLVFSGSAEGEMRVWRFDHEAMSAGLQENESGEVCAGHASCVRCCIDAGLSRSQK